MLYALHDAAHAAMLPARLFARTASALMRDMPGPDMMTWSTRAAVAWSDVTHDLLRPRGKPEWDIREVGGSDTPLAETIELDQPFVRLLRFARPNTSGPRVLLVAPMSGHHATLLRGTTQDLMDTDHEVYVTDWRDARIVPQSAGEFGLADYIDTIIGFLRHLGPDTHVIAVCQPAPAVVAAVSLLASRRENCQPRSMTLMGGPVDTRAAPTAVTKLAEKHPITWFEQNLVATVPAWHAGAFRRVYPGFMQLAAFMSMNPDRHIEAHKRMFEHLIKGDADSVAAHRKFYDEYLAVMDVPAGYYLETVDQFFIQHTLGRGIMKVRDERIDPAAIERTALMTVEGELDDISAPGQTLAAQTLCSSIPEERRTQYLQLGVGHYGIFNGRRWRSEILPRVAEFMRAS